MNMNSLVNQPDVTAVSGMPGSLHPTTDAEMLAEAAMLREHRNRLENRMVILEEHNRQLESQLSKLKQILEPGGSAVNNKTGTLNTKSVTPSQLATDSPILPHKISNGNYTSDPGQPISGLLYFQHPADPSYLKVPPGLSQTVRDNVGVRESGVSNQRQQFSSENGFQTLGGHGSASNLILSGLSTVKRNSMTRAEGQIL